MASNALCILRAGTVPGVEDLCVSSIVAAMWQQPLGAHCRWRPTQNNRCRNRTTWMMQTRKISTPSPIECLVCINDDHETYECQQIRSFASFIPTRIRDFQRCRSFNNLESMEQPKPRDADQPPRHDWQRRRRGRRNDWYRSSLTGSGNNFNDDNSHGARSSPLPASQTSQRNGVTSAKR